MGLYSRYWYIGLSKSNNLFYQFMDNIHEVHFINDAASKPLLATTLILLFKLFFCRNY
jgi:hypothetical protein